MSNPSDADLMMLADGELNLAEASAVERRAGEVGARKIEGIKEVGELIRGHLELATDEADSRLVGLWDLVERRLEVPDEAPNEVRSPRESVRVGGWRRVGRWMDRHRAHFFTGALSAGAVAAVALLVRSPTVVVRTVSVPGPAPTPTLQVRHLQPTAPHIESLEVNGGTGTIFTIESDDGSGDTAVIWITPDDVVEGI